MVPEVKAILLLILSFVISVISSTSCVGRKKNDS